MSGDTYEYTWDDVLPTNRMVMFDGTWGTPLQEGLLIILSVVFAIIGAVAVGYAIYLGIMLAKAGDESKRQQAKSRMMKTFAGLFIVVILFTTLQVVDGMDFWTGTKEWRYYEFSKEAFRLSEVSGNGYTVQLLEDREPVSGAITVTFENNSAGVQITSNSNGNHTLRANEAGTALITITHNQRIVMHEVLIIIYPNAVAIPPIVLDPPPEEEDEEEEDTRPPPLANGNIFWASTPNSMTRGGSGVGSPRPSTTNRARHHLGIDKWGGAGGPAYAAWHGTIVTTGRHGTLDEFMLIRHTFHTPITVMQGGQVRSFSTLFTMYVHINIPNHLRAPGSVGRTVGAGEQIGTIRSSSTGGHVHFQIQLNQSVTRPNPSFAAGRTVADVERLHNIINPIRFWPERGTTNRSQAGPGTGLWILDGVAPNAQ